MKGSLKDNVKRFFIANLKRKRKLHAKGLHEGSQ